MRGEGEKPGREFKAGSFPLTPVQVEVKLLSSGQSCQNKVKGVKNNVRRSLRDGLSLDPQGGVGGGAGGTGST